VGREQKGRVGQLVAGLLGGLLGGLFGREGGGCRGEGGGRFSHKSLVRGLFACDGIRDGVGIW
jgi:hypothetical protein